MISYLCTAIILSAFVKAQYLEEPSPAPMEVRGTEASTASAKTTTKPTINPFLLDESLSHHPWVDMDATPAPDHWERSVYASASLHNPWVIATLTMVAVTGVVLCVCMGTTCWLGSGIRRAGRRLTKARTDKAREPSQREVELGQMLCYSTARYNSLARAAGKPLQEAPSLLMLTDQGDLRVVNTLALEGPSALQLQQAGTGVEMVSTPSGAAKGSTASALETISEPTDGSSEKSAAASTEEQ
jgi:hypothetical protein